MKPTRLILFGVAALAGWQPHAKAQTFVNLGSAQSFGVLGGASVTNTGNTIINGNLGSSPTATITGFPPGTVNGVLTDGPTTAAAQTDLASAYNAITGQSATVSGVTAYTTTTLFPGVYSAPASLSLSGTITLNGNGATNSVFIFKAASTLLVADNTQIVLTNGASAQNVFWQVGSSATFGSTAVFAGDVLAFTSITVGPGTTVLGGLLAEGGTVALNNDTVSAIPEPATTALVAALGVFGLTLWRRRRLAA